MNLMFPAAKGVINPHLHWPPGTKLRVYFRTGKFPTWRMNSHPRMEFLTCGKILEMANIWRRRGGVTIPELVLTEDIQESDIRVFLSVHRPSMSYVGTEAKNYEMEDTMVLNLSRNDDDFRQYVVVHTFGHALGLGHMHQSSYLVKALDEHLTIEWLQEESGLSLEDAVKKFNADFKSYAGECTTEMGYFDASSVMCYPIDKKCFKSQTDHGLQQEDYDLITKTDDYSIRSGPSAADIRNVQAMYEVNPTSITTHPADQLLLVPGSPASFTVSVEAIPGHDHTYQWQKNKIDIVGATSNALIISSVTKTDEGTYCCVVSNTAGPVTSDPARLTIYADRDKISSSPGSKSGGEATYDVFISYKNGAVSEGYATAIDRHLTEAGYKVYRDEKNLAGGTTINKELAAAIHNSSVFLPILCSQYVTKPGERWCQSELNYAKEENKRFLPVVIDGVPIPPHILLIIDPQIKRLEYDSANPQPCIKEVTRSIQGMLGSRSESPPTVKSHPTGQLILVPRSLATFSVSVEAIPGHNYIYQWQKNKTDIPGATLNTYTIQSVTKANEGLYHCVVRNAAASGISSSDPVQLTVCEDRSPKEIYDSALSHGHINVRNVLCLINGAAGAGKTSVKYLLYGWPPPQHLESTPFADSVLRPMRIERMSTDTKQYEWIELKADEQIRAIITEAMTVETKKKTQQTKPQIPHEPVVAHQVVEESASRKTQESATQGTQESVTRETQESASQGTRESASQGAQGPVSQETQEEHVTTTVMKDLLTLIAKLSDTRKEILDLQHCYIIDSGGQSAFQELLSLFFGDIHVSISVLDLSKRLDARPIDKLTMDCKEYGSLIKCALTQQDILECTFRALQTQMSSTEEAESEAAGGKFPFLIIVGTHKDEEHKIERIPDKNDKLFQILKRNNYERHIISCGSHIENVLFSVDAKNPDDEDRRIVKQLKHDIAGIFTSLDKTPIPIKWYVLELCLRQKKVHILTYAQCCEIAEQLEMKEDDLTVMLDHLMKLKTLFYFKDVECLRNLVFINPQPLLNRLSQLVEMKYHLHGNSNKDADRNFCKGRMTLEYISSEEFQRLLLKCRFQSYEVDDSMFSFGQFLELLVHKRVATKISRDEYFLPFILDKMETSELYQHVKHDKYIAPLAICFPGGVAPAGVFCCLVASFLSLTYNPSQQSPWKFEHCPLYRNILKFKFKQTPQDFSLTLLDAYTHFEAHINMPSSEAFSHLVTEICSCVRSEVVKCLKEMCEGRKLSYKLAIVCQPEVARCGSESHDVSHYAMLLNTGKDTVYDCVNESCIGRYEPITARAKCWDLGNVNPPSIKTHPADQLMLVPQSSASFNVSMEAIPGCDYTYQWHKNETDIVGATSNAHIISSVTKTDEGTYCCAVSNPAGSVTSDPAQLTVLYPPTVKVHPADQLVQSSANFTVSVEDIPGHDHTYQWQKNNINIVGATSDAHTITCVVKTDEGTYCCVVSNAAGTVTSDLAQLTVLNPPTIINHPTNQLMLVPRSSANFTVSVGAIPEHDHTYQWHKNKTVIVGAISNSHTISSVSETDQGTYYCVVSNPAGSVTSNPAQLTVLNPPTIKTHPADQLMLVPQSPASFTLSVEAIPGHDHTYQWQKNKIDIVGAMSNSHTISSVSETDQGTYYCVVSNPAGSVTSNPAQLTVLNPPTIKTHPADQLMLVPQSPASFTLSVEAIPGHDHTYQWQKNKIDIVGATSNAHTITCVVKTDEGTYCCVVSNTAGSVTSDPARLTMRLGRRGRGRGCAERTWQGRAGRGPKGAGGSHVTLPGQRVLQQGPPPTYCQQSDFPGRNEKATMVLLDKFPDGKGGHFCIPGHIPVEKMKPFGIALLPNGAVRVSSIIFEKRGEGVAAIIRQFLMEWVQGQGKEDYTWNGLIEVLREPAINLRRLADEIEDVVGKSTTPRT